MSEMIGAHSSPILGPDGKPGLRCPDDWKGPPIERMNIPTRAECGPQFSGMPIVIASRHSPGRRWYRCHGSTQEISMNAPGVDFLSATYERDYGRWNCEPGGQTVCLRLPPSVVQRYIHEDAQQFDLDTRYAFKDKLLTDAIFTLAGEIEQGLPNGALYAEGLSLMILGWLHQHYNCKKHTTSPSARSLSAAQKTSVRDFVDAHLGENLSIERMAAAVGLSPYHFSRLFRSSFGMPPHSHVLNMRVNHAARLLRMEQQRSIADIALATGFASQAHLTHAFKKLMHQTPARWRVS